LRAANLTFVRVRLTAFGNSQIGCYPERPEVTVTDGYTRAEV
jgi:hypothetical protein